MLQSNDNQAIPEEGVTFDVSIGRGEDTKVVQITLKNLLQGVNLLLKEGNDISQAQMLANRLVSKGYTTEDEAMAAFSRVHPTQSWRIIQIIGAQNSDNRVMQTVARWTQEGRLISGNQIGLGTNMAAALREHGLIVLADNIDRAIQADEVTDGPKAAALFALINKGQNLLPKDHPLSTASRETRRREQGRDTSEDGDEDAVLVGGEDPEIPFG